MAFEEIVRMLGRRIEGICNDARIPGMERGDVRQEALLALRFGAIRDYDEKRGRFEGFAALCIRRHLTTVFKSVYSHKSKALSSAVPLDSGERWGGEEGNWLCDRDGDPAETTERMESCRRMLSELVADLSPFERLVLQRYARGETYETMARALGTDCKSIDNALQRIKFKAKRLTGQEENQLGRLTSWRPRDFNSQRQLP